MLHQHFLITLKLGNLQGDSERQLRGLRHGLSPLAKMLAPLGCRIASLYNSVSYVRLSQAGRRLRRRSGTPMVRTEEPKGINESRAPMYSQGEAGRAPL